LPGAPGNYLSILGAIQKVKTVPRANFYLMLLPPFFPPVGLPNGAGIGEVSGSSSWYPDCTQRVLMHELLHNVGLYHSGAYTTDGVFHEYFDESSVMSQAFLLFVNQKKDPVGWLGLGAPHLVQLGWMAMLSITANGDYTINSLSSNTGVRAATVGPYWLEWRQAINQDVDLQFTQNYFRTLRNTGQVLGSLLIKTVHNSQTALQAVVEPGKSVTLGDFTFCSFPHLEGFA
jgi:hypothetical protein